MHLRKLLKMISLGRSGTGLKPLRGLMGGLVPGGTLRGVVVRLAWDPGEQMRCQEGVSHEPRVVSTKYLWGERMAD